MFTAKTLLSIVTLAAAAAQVLAQPHRQLELAAVANTTMCPIHVEYNDEPNRIPRRIKFLQCASSPNRLCSEQHMTHGCCKQHHSTFQSECVEIYDWVPVRYHNKDGPKRLRVPVGCTCLIERSQPAPEGP